MTPPVVYIAGPYRARTTWLVGENIQRAREVAGKVWAAGMIALCPHLNTAHFDGLCPDETWLAGDLVLLQRCDALLTVPGYRPSTGSMREIQFALDEQMPVFHVLYDLTSWKRDVWDQEKHHRFVTPCSLKQGTITSLESKEGV